MSFLDKVQKPKIIEPEDTAKIGKDMSFAAVEAYKRLRTNILFSFAGESTCRIIGVTSSTRGEGKSTTSCNLAYSLAEAGKRTLLIDADLRLSNVHKLLDLNVSPGLSNLLVGINDGSNLIQMSGLHKNLMVISAGDVPPNPSELLSSKRMQSTLHLLAEKFDYIIVDLPPVEAVVDALIVSKLVHGMVVVVRQSYADKHALDNTIRQLQFHEANILGLVVNCANIGHKSYKNNYYKEYRAPQDDE